ncbi:MAG: phenylalanine--tRNA ligase subunit beta [Deltaproteobacteria bacterium]|nr:phenylalanine--tRNA ligase subunit beta [Deltaproteobacteria bacterium]
MLYSYNWLKEYVDNLPPAHELAERLTMSGAEVEGVAASGPAIKDVFTAEVLSVAQHPNADRLSLCEVNTGKEKLSIVCGAKNMVPGDKVALAVIGAELHGGVKIKKSKIRGVESHGMMCSEVELGIKESSDGIMLLPKDAPLGVLLNEYLNLNDYILNVNVTPNRADLLSVVGLAREASVITGAGLKLKDVKPVDGGALVETIISVTIADGAPCRRYSARVITGVKVAPTPEYIRKRLEASGVRAVNNVVDATNYVMLETGQPLHAFDLDKIQERKINVRLAVTGETIDTLDGHTRKLDPDMLVIADADNPVAIAGVMGAKFSEVGAQTENIIIESAWFEPASVRRTSKRLGLTSESSYRFERGVDVEGVVKAIDRVAAMIAETCGGQVAKGVVDVYPVRFKPADITFRIKKALSLLGVGAELRDNECLEILTRLGITSRKVSEGFFTVTPPSFRHDIKNESDIIEEVARVRGYDKIPCGAPVAPLASSASAERGVNGIRDKIREILVNAGFFEVMNLSFVSPAAFESSGFKREDAVKILNPLSEENSVMRASLAPSLLENLRYNLDRKNEEVRIFEIAPVFMRGEKLPAEKWICAGLIYGARNGLAWNTPKDWADFYDVKGAMERVIEGVGAQGFETSAKGSALMHPGKSAAFEINGEAIAVLGETHPDIQERFGLKRPAYIFELDMDALGANLGAGKKYSALARFPESSRDVAFLIDKDAAYGDIFSAIIKIDTKLIESAEVFDVYYGENIPAGKKSVALRVTYRSKDKTLTYDEVSALHAKVGAELTGRFGAELRV